MTFFVQSFFSHFYDMVNRLQQANYGIGDFCPHFVVKNFHTQRIPARNDGPVAFPKQNHHLTGLESVSADAFS